MTFRTINYKNSVFIRYGYIDHTWRVVAEDLLNQCLYPVDTAAEFPILDGISFALIDGYEADQVMETVSMKDAEIILTEITDGCSVQEGLLNWFQSFRALLNKTPGPLYDPQAEHRRLEYLRTQAEMLAYSQIDWDAESGVVYGLCPDCALAYAEEADV